MDQPSPHYPLRRRIRRRQRASGLQQEASFGDAYGHYDSSDGERFEHRAGTERSYSTRRDHHASWAPEIGNSNDGHLVYDQSQNRMASTPQPFGLSSRSRVLASRRRYEGDADGQPTRDRLIPRRRARSTRQSTPLNNQEKGLSSQSFRRNGSPDYVSQPTWLKYITEAEALKDKDVPLVERAMDDLEAKAKHYFVLYAREKTKREEFERQAFWFEKANLQLQEKLEVEMTRAEQLQSKVNSVRGHPAQLRSIVERIDLLYAQLDTLVQSLTGVCCFLAYKELDREQAIMVALDYLYPCRSLDPRLNALYGSIYYYNLGLEKEKPGIPKPPMPAGYAPYGEGTPWLPPGEKAPQAEPTVFPEQEPIMKEPSTKREDVVKPKAAVVKPVVKPETEKRAAVKPSSPTIKKAPSDPSLPLQGFKISIYRAEGFPASNKPLYCVFRFDHEKPVEVKNMPLRSTPKITASTGTADINFITELRELPPKVAGKQKLDNRINDDSHVIGAVPSYCIDVWREDDAAPLGTAKKSFLDKETLGDKLMWNVMDPNDKQIGSISVAIGPIPPASLLPAARVGEAKIPTATSKKAAVEEKKKEPETPKLQDTKPKAPEVKPGMKKEPEAKKMEVVKKSPETKGVAPLGVKPKGPEVKKPLEMKKPIGAEVKKPEALLKGEVKKPEVGVKKPEALKPPPKKPEAAQATAVKKPLVFKPEQKKDFAPGKAEATPVKPGEKNDITKKPELKVAPMKPAKPGDIPKKSPEIKPGGKKTIPTKKPELKPAAAELGAKKVKVGAKEVKIEPKGVQKKVEAKVEGKKVMGKEVTKTKALGKEAAKKEVAKGAAKKEIGGKTVKKEISKAKGTKGVLTKAGKEPAGKAAKEPAGKAAKEPAGKVAKEPAGKAAKEPPGKAAKEPAGKAAKEPPGKAAKEPAGKAAKEPAGKAAKEPAGKAAKEPAGKAAKEPAGKAAKELAAKAAKGTSSKATTGTSSKATKGTPTKAAKGTPTKAAKGTPTKAAKGTPTKAAKGTPTKGTIKVAKGIQKKG